MTTLAIRTPPRFIRTPGHGSRRSRRGRLCPAHEHHHRAPGLADTPTGSGKSAKGTPAVSTYRGASGWSRRRAADLPVVLAAHECIQGILWSDLVGLAPLGHRFPDGLTAVAVEGIPATQLVVAWRRTTRTRWYGHSPA